MSVVFQTSRSETRNMPISHKLPLLDSHLCSLPKPATIILYNSNIQKKIKLLKAFLHKSYIVKKSNLNEHFGFVLPLLHDTAQFKRKMPLQIHYSNRENASFPFIHWERNRRIFCHCSILNWQIFLTSDCIGDVPLLEGNLHIPPTN